MGFRLRSQTEFLRYGVMGKVPMVRLTQPNVVTAPPGRHSQKPHVFHDLLELMSPDAHVRVEWFAREHRPGWVCTGLELDGVDVRAWTLEPENKVPVRYVGPFSKLKRRS